MENEVQESAEPEQNSSKKYIIISLVVLLVLIVIALFVFYLRSADNISEPSPTPVINNSERMNIDVENNEPFVTETTTPSPNLQTMIPTVTPVANPTSTPQNSPVPTQDLDFAPNPTTTPTTPPLPLSN